MQLTEDERAALERYRVLMAKMRGDGSDGSITGILGRCSREELYEQGSIGVTLANMVIDRLFPVRTYGDIVVRWDDPITPERLVACGFVFIEREDSGNKYFQRHAMVKGIHSTYVTVRAFSRFTGSSEIGIVSGAVKYEIDGQCVSIPHEYQPRNMLEVWQLMERCGIEEGGK